MDFEIKKSRNVLVLFIKVNRDIELNFFLSLMKECSIIADKSNTRHFIFDLSYVESEASAIEQYYFAKKLRSTGFPPESKIAFLADENINQHIFLETVLSNVGFIVRFFTNRDKAYKWVTKLLK